MKAGGCLAAVAVLLLAASASATTEWYFKSNNQEVLYGILAKEGTTDFAVYIDPDNSADTGFETHDVGADFKVTSSGALLKNAGGDTWTEIGKADVSITTTTKDGKTMAKFEAIVKRSDITETVECEEQTSLVIEAEGKKSYRVVHRLTPGNKDCYPPVHVKTTSTLSTITYTMASMGTWPDWKVYLDTDLDPSTGAPLDDGWTGGDFMVSEGGKLSKYNAGSWVEVATVAYTDDARWGVKSWTVPRDLIGDAEGCDLEASAAYEVGNGEWVQSTVTRIESDTDCIAQTVVVPEGVSVCEGAACPMASLDARVATVAEGTRLASVGGEGDIQGMSSLGVLDLDPGVVPRGTANRVRRAQASGVNVLGYVSVEYGARPIKDVKAEIDMYYNAVPFMRGILLDEMYSNDCKQIGYMCALKSYTKSKFGLDAIVAANPKVVPPQCYMDCVDILITSDTTSAAYLSHKPDDEWVKTFSASRFASIVEAMDPAEVPEIIKKSKERHTANVIVRMGTKASGKGRRMGDILPDGKLKFFLGKAKRNAKVGANGRHGRRSRRV